MKYVLFRNIGLYSMSCHLEQLTEVTLNATYHFSFFYYVIDQSSVADPDSLHPDPAPLRFPLGHERLIVGRISAFHTKENDRINLKSK